MAKTFKFDLNMDKQKRDPNIVYARVGDTDSVIVQASLYDGTNPFTPAGANAYFECVCPNGASVRQSATKSGSLVSVTLASQVFQAAGVINVAYFRFETGSTSDPTYVESTEPFVIIVLSGIDDNISAEDYIAEWRSLQEQFAEIVDFAESAYPTIQKAVSDVVASKNEALTTINDAKASVEEAAKDVMTPINEAIAQMQQDADGVLDAFTTDGNTAINTFKSNSSAAVTEFKSNSQAEIDAFDTSASTKIQQFETNASGKLSQYDSDVSEKLTQVDSSISSATQKIDQNVAELDKATQDAIDAMEAALSEDQYGELLQRISRVWKLDNQDMVMIPDSADLNSYVAVGSYYASESSSHTNGPDDMSAPFVMYVIKVTSTKSIQFLVPAEHEAGNDYIKLYIREVENSTFSDWYPIGGAGGTKIDLPISIANGGTGATSAAQARQNIGAGTSDFSGDYNDLENKPSIPSLPISIANGGTGATTAAQARQNIGAGTSNFSGSYNDLTDKPELPGPPDDYLHTVSTTDGRLLRGESGNVTNINVSDSPDENGVAGLYVSTSSNAQAYTSATYYTSDKKYAIVKSSAHDPDIAGPGQVSVEVLGQNTQGSQFNMAVLNATSDSMHDKIQFFMHQQDADGSTNKQAQFMIDYSGTSAVGSASLPWDWGYFGSLQLSNALGIAYGGTGAKNINTARENLDAAKASVTSTYSTLSGSNEVTGSLSDSVHTKFTLDQLLEWLKDQGIGGSQDGMVAGVIYPYTGSAIPNGFLLCNGAAVSRTTYSKLFEAIGTTYGAGDGSSTFNLPNLKQRMLIGSGDDMANGTTGGSNTHQHEYGVTFGEYYSGIVKPLRTYDYGTSAPSDNVVHLGVTPVGTTVNSSTQESSRNPSSLPFEYVAYGNTKEASSLPQYLVVNYIISTGEVDAIARSGGFSIDYPITIANGGTSATTQEAAEYNIVQPTSVNGIPTMDDEVVFINGSASSSNGRLSSYKLSYAYVPIFSQIMGEVFTGAGGTLPVNSGGTGVTSISALRRSLKLYSGSKVINNGDTYAVLFTNSEYAGITGRGFNIGTDCVLVMNGDADATQTEFYCTTWKASTGNIGIFCGSAGARRVNYFIIAP